VGLFVRDTCVDPNADGYTTMQDHFCLPEPTTPVQFGAGVSLLYLLARRRTSPSSRRARPGSVQTPDRTRVG
jgi:hypothetical protein